MYNGEIDPFENNIQGKLFRDLLSNYEHGSYMRPVMNTSTVTTVTYRMLVHELIDLVSIEPPKFVY